VARYKDLSDPALARELRRRARLSGDLRDAVERAAAAAAVVPAQNGTPLRADLPVAKAPNGSVNGRAIDDSASFAALIGDVSPLAAPARSRSRPAPPAPQPRQRTADDEEALNASRIAVNPSPMAWDVGLDIESAQSFVRAGLNPDLLRKLRRGDWVVQGALDLHKHTQEQARVALGEFLSLARRQGWRCVRIVHGKGLSSPNREPVLKAKVRKWLQQRDDVLAYCEPRPHAGGSGAVHVLLAGAA
jgi:DNA-nicking Smr family endonuclease